MHTKRRLLFSLAGIIANPYAAFAGDVLTVFAEGVSAAVRAALPGVSYTGVSGLIEFDEIGDAKRDAAYIKAANTESGEWEFVKVQGID